MLRNKGIHESNFIGDTYIVSARTHYQNDTTSYTGIDKTRQAYIISIAYMYKFSRRWIITKLSMHHINISSVRLTNLVKLMAIIVGKFFNNSIESFHR